MLLHGGGFDRADLSWGAVIDRLAAERRLIAPDLPGYGGTDGFGRPHDLGDLTDWLRKFLDHLGLPRIDVAGLSMGGGMALRLALDAPERVRRLVPVASYGLTGRLPFDAAARRLARSETRLAFYHAAAGSALAVRAGLFMAVSRPWTVPRDVVAEIREVAAEQAERRSFGAFLAGELAGQGRGLRGDLTARLPGLTRPALFIHGARDPLVPLRHARAATAAIPGARLVVLRSGHWPPRDCPGRVSREIRDFLDAPVTGSDAAAPGAGAR
ncbi:alpha/beta fold hydrolase [Wenxinia saemankumensis]|uniref:alpha/beta fold hydrolase n=1 Tax=Wenxinia saemankumensis TaxID=1447782 RepID=UPI00147C1275|nr:alpha/beta fold hydrolase [Wenxinia saemankumensis]